MLISFLKKLIPLTGIFSISLLMSLNTHASPIDIDIYKEVNDSIIDNSDPFFINFTGLTLSSSDVKITFTVFGDFSNSNEWIDLSVDSYSFGRWLNHANLDDNIMGPGSLDTGNEYVSNIVGRATLSPDDFNFLLVGDDEVSFKFDYNRIIGNDSGILSYVHNLRVGDYAKVELSYTAAVPQPSLSVPEPSLNITLIIGLMGLFLLKRRSLPAA
ncbi:MAG: hypothetical protein HOP23_17370 [Methylococcaceae bacterium]|nr:hypothetical protein [Methylococcaceae bacterium]